MKGLRKDGTLWIVYAARLLLQFINSDYVRLLNDKAIDEELQDSLQKATKYLNSLKQESLAGSLTLNSACGLIISSSLLHVASDPDSNSGSLNDAITAAKDISSKKKATTTTAYEVLFDLILSILSLPPAWNRSVAVQSFSSLCSSFGATSIDVFVDVCYAQGQRC